jgi:predicted  nucleic acid-binding Zn-ribbon protein
MDYDDYARMLPYPRCTCLRCGKVWDPRTPHKPRTCPGCRSVYWDIPKKEKGAQANEVSS